MNEASVNTCPCTPNSQNILRGQNTASTRARTLFATTLLALSLMLPLSCVLSPARALADQPDTDIICGTAESERQDDLDDRPNITAKNAMVIGEDGTVYFERAADEQVKIASITKVMTAIVALENADLEDEVTVSATAAATTGSSAYLLEGDVLTLEEALRALLIPSGNDAAMAIAETVGTNLASKGESAYDAFVAAMNKKAQELGMEAEFTNPHGLDVDEWGTDMHASARDVAKMFAYAMKNGSFRALTASTNNVISVTGADGTERDLYLTEVNDLLGKDGNIGGKTGTTGLAGRCFVGAWSRETGGEIYTIVLGIDETTNRFDESKALADWYYNHIQSYPAISSDQIAADGNPLVAKAIATDWSDRTVDVTAADPNQQVQVFNLAGALTQEVSLKELSGNVKCGDEAGTITISQDGHAVATVQLVAAQDQASPNPLEWILVQLDRLGRILTGQPTTAESSVISEVYDFSQDA